MEENTTTQRLRRSISMPADGLSAEEMNSLERLNRDYLKHHVSSDNIPENGNELAIELLKIRHPRKCIKRAIEKNGSENVKLRNVPEQFRYMRDFVTTMIGLNWTYMSLIFMGTYFITWFIFGALCYWVAYEHGDFTLDEITGESRKDVCFTDIHNYVSMFLYSIGTQTTIGFNQNPSEDCPGAMILLMIQMIVSICIEGALLSLIYAKAVSPAKQINKLKFSDKAVICYRDGLLCLLFRVCDARQQQSIESKIRVFIIQDKITQEDEALTTQIELKLMNNGEQIIAWPEVVCHVIDETSPLNYIKSARDLTTSEFELYVSIAGCSPSTTQVTEARTSYVPQEIFWGQRFLNITEYDELNDHYIIDFAKFSSTVSVDMTNNPIIAERLNEE